MENLAIETAQNISIEQKVGSVGERIVSSAIDLAILSAWIGLSGIITAASKTPVVFFILLVPALTYDLFCETFMNGQSPGKKVMGLRVVKIDGSPVTFISYFLRWVFRIVDVLFLFGAVATVTIIINGKGQRFGDMAANTAVIRVRKRRVGTGIIVQLPENYTIVFPQVNRLNDNDIATIREVLSFMRDSYNNQASTGFAEKTRIAIEKKLNIKSDLPTSKFLSTLVYDYNCLHTS